MVGLSVLLSRCKPPVQNVSDTCSPGLGGDRNGEECSSAFKDAGRGAQVPRCFSDLTPHSLQCHPHVFVARGVSYSAGGDTDVLRRSILIHVVSWLFKPVVTVPARVGFLVLK